MRKYVILFLVLLISTFCVIAKDDNDSLYKGFMSVYGTLNDAIKTSISQNGSVDSWDWSQGEDYIFDTYLKPNLSIAKTCEMNQVDCWKASAYRALGERTADSPVGLHKTYVLENGTSMMFTLKDANCKESGHTCAFIWVDVNGFEDPNTMGRDYFKFYIHPKSSKILPVGYSYDKEPDVKSINKSCSLMSTGNYCGAKLLIEHGMNY